MEKQTTTDGSELPITRAPSFVHNVKEKSVNNHMTHINVQNQKKNYVSYVPYYTLESNITFCAWSFLIYVTAIQHLNYSWLVSVLSQVNR